MSLSERLAENVRACFAGIWIQSHEHEDALLLGGNDLPRLQLLKDVTAQVRSHTTLKRPGLEVSTESMVEIRLR